MATRRSARTLCCARLRRAALTTRLGEGEGEGVGEGEGEGEGEDEGEGEGEG